MVATASLVLDIPSISEDISTGGSGDSQANIANMSQTGMLTIYDFQRVFVAEVGLSDGCRVDCRISELVFDDHRQRSSSKMKSREYQVACTVTIGPGGDL